MFTYYIKVVLKTSRVNSGKSLNKYNKNWNNQIQYLKS